MIMEDTPIRDIDKVASLFRETLKEYAQDFVVLPLLENIPYKEAVESYVKVIHISDDYHMWKKHVHGILNDCVRIHKMERWMAESMLGLNLDEEVINGFELAWKESEKTLR